jgi:hypothetical protein
MRCNVSVKAGWGPALFLVLASCAWGQSEVIGKIQSGIDNVVKGLDYVGKKTEQLVGPGLGLGEPQKAAYTETRLFEERYPVGAAPVVSISNEFGEIRVEAWDDRVVQVSAQIVVGAETPEAAAQVAEAVKVDVAAAEDLVEIRTVLPETRVVSVAVNYTLTIPRSASLVSDNFFGDTLVRGLNGMVAVEAQYGQVDLADLGGPVKARVRGEFPLKAARLARGGVFQVHGAQAEFSEVSGELRINNLWGTVLVRDLSADAYVDISSDSGPVRVALPADAQPDVTASIIYGSFETDFPVSQSAQNNRIVARHPNPESGLQVVLNAYFGDVRLERQGPAGAPPPGATEGTKPFNDVITREETGGGMTLAVDAAVGDVRIEGVDEDRVKVTATRIVWVPVAAQAPPALEALGLQLQRTEDRLSVSTAVTQDLAALECRSYRIDLLIQCPRTMTVNIVAQDGQTSVEGLGAPVTVNQTSGSVTARHNKGSLTLSNQNGNIDAQDCSGPVEATGRYGMISLKNVFERISVQNVQGRTIIESAKGEVVVRNSGGDVRILALDGVGGNYDILAEQGDISILTGPETDAALSAKSTGGAIDSALPLTGSVTRGAQELQGRLKDGRFTIRLETQSGDIVIN